MTCPKGCCETYREHLLSIGISASALPTRGKARYAVNRSQAEKQLSKDLVAYKELVSNGTQPRQIDGCHELQMKAETKAEVEAGRPVTKKGRSQLKRLHEAGVNVGEV